MNLNKQQREIVEAPLNPVLVIASAGTGKTRVLTERIIYLLKQPSISINNILAITFTNLAAEEMKVRIARRIQKINSIPVSIGTIHSLFGEILRRDVEKVCKKRNHAFELLQEDGQVWVLRRAFEFRVKRPPSKWQMEDVKRLLSEWKMGIYFNRDVLTESERISYEDVFETYEKMLIEENRMDYDDVLILTLKLFEENEEIREFWIDRYKAILIDECQDLNEIQWKLIKQLIPNKNANFFMVGDPNQCIYIFNGAKENIFEDIKVVFPNLLIKNLYENYRCAESIVNWSNDIKCIDTQKSCPRRDCKGEIVVSETSELALNQLLQTKDFSKWAVLFKKHSDSNLVVSFLAENKIPFKISKFYLLEDPFIQKIINILRIIFFDNWHPIQHLIWSELFQFDYGTKRLLTSKESIPYGISPLDWLIRTTRWKDLDLSDSELKKIEYFVEKIKEFRSFPKDSIEKLVLLIKDFVISSEISRFPEKKFNLFFVWVKNLQKEYSLDSTQEIVLNLKNYSEFSKESIKTQDHDSVTLSTIYKTKGLEWDNVIVLGYRVLHNEFKERTKDKHLAYVAVTRAKDKLFIVLDK